MDNDAFRRILLGQASTSSDRGTMPAGPAATLDEAAAVETAAAETAAAAETVAAVAPVLSWPELVRYDGGMVARAIQHDRPDVGFDIES